MGLLHSISEWCGHRQIPLIVAWTTALGADLVLPFPDNIIALFVGIGILTIGLTGGMAHANPRFECKRCAEGRPTDGALRVVLHLRELKTFHGSLGRLFIAIFVLFVAGAFWHPLWLLANFTMMWVQHVLDVHLRYRPWCPACRGGWEDDEILEAPDPINSGSK